MSHILYKAAVACYCLSLPIAKLSGTTTTNNEILKMNNHLIAQDKQNQSISITWQKTTLTDQAFAAAMASIWPVAKLAYIPVEMNFLRSFPDVVGKEPYFKSFEPLFKDGIERVDWSAAEACMKEILKGHFVFDSAKFSETMVAMFAQDACYFVEAKESKTNELVGFMTILARKSYAPGEVKIMSLGVDPAHQNRGIGKMLMASTLSIIPDIKRIFLCTRVSNEVALRAYQSWGFKIDQKPILDHAFNMAHWTFMDYNVRASGILETAAKNLRN